MEDKKMIHDFGDMVTAAQKLTKPWITSLIVTNVLWAVIVAMLVWFAYMTPVEMTQEQDLTTEHQTQSYIDGTTSGN